MQTMSNRQNQQLKILLIPKKSDIKVPLEQVRNEKTPKKDLQFYNLFKQTQQLFKTNNKKQHQQMLERKLKNSNTVTNTELHTNLNPVSQDTTFNFHKKSPFQIMSCQPYQVFKNQSAVQQEKHSRNLQSSQSFRQNHINNKANKEFNRVNAIITNPNLVTECHDISTQPDNLSSIKVNKDSVVQYLKTSNNNEETLKDRDANQISPTKQSDNEDLRNSNLKNEIFQKTLFTIFLESKRKSWQNCNKNNYRWRSPVQVRTYKAPYGQNIQEENYNSLDFQSKQRVQTYTSPINQQLPNPNPSIASFNFGANQFLHIQNYKEIYNRIQNNFQEELSKKQNAKQFNAVNYDSSSIRQSPIHTNFEQSSNMKKRLKRTSLKLNPCEVKAVQQQLQMANRLSFTSTPQCKQYPIMVDGILQQQQQQMQAEVLNAYYYQQYARMNTGNTSHGRYRPGINLWNDNDNNQQLINSSILSPQLDQQQHMLRDNQQMLEEKSNGSRVGIYEIENQKQNEDRTMKSDAMLDQVKIMNGNLKSHIQNVVQENDFDVRAKTVHYGNKKDRQPNSFKKHQQITLQELVQKKKDENLGVEQEQKKNYDKGKIGIDKKVQKNKDIEPWSRMESDSNSDA